MLLLREREWLAKRTFGRPISFNAMFLNVGLEGSKNPLVRSIPFNIGLEDRSKGSAFQRVLVVFPSWSLRQRSTQLPRMYYWRRSE